MPVNVKGDIMDDFHELMDEIFELEFGVEPDDYFSAPGRTEICGNHCDHQHGMVIAGAINRSIDAVVKFREDKKVCLASKGFQKVECKN